MIVKVKRRAIDKPKSLKNKVKDFNNHKKTNKIDGSKFLTPDFEVVKSVALNKDWFLRIVKTKADKKYFIDIRKFADTNTFTKGAFLPVKLFHTLVENLVDFITTFEQNKIEYK